MALGPQGNSGDWATEATLKKIENLTFKNNSLLSGFLNKKGGLEETIDELDEEFKELTDLIGKNRAEEYKDLKFKSDKRNAEYRLQRLREEANSSYTNSVNNLRKSLNVTSSSIGNSSNAAGTFGSILTNAATDLSANLAKTGKAGAVLGASLMLITTTVTYFVKKLIETRDAYTGMIQSGLFFNGNLLDFGARVRETGLTISEFSAIAEKYSTTILVNGENSFLKTIKSLGGTFDKFGLNIKDGTDYYADYLDTLRTSGSLYYMTQQEQIAAFKENIAQQTAQARLTGISVKQQKEEAKAVAQKKSFQLMMASLPKEQKDFVETARRQLQAVMSPDQIEDTLMFAMKGIMKGGGVSAGLLNLTPQGFRQISDALKSGSLEGIQAGVETYRGEVGAKMGSPDMDVLAAQAYMGKGVGADMANSFADTLQRISPSLFGDAAQRAADAAKIGAGESPMDASSQAVFTSTRLFAEAIGKLDSEAMFAGAKGMTALNEQIKKLAENMKDLTPEKMAKMTKDAMIDFAKEHVTGLALGAAGTAATMYGARRYRKMMGGGTGGGGGAGGTGGGGGKGGRFRGRGGLIGMGVGLAADAGSYLAGDENPKTSALLNILGTTGEYAGYGAMGGALVPVAGETGISELIGGILGGGYGLYKGISQNYDTLFPTTKPDNKITTTDQPLEDEDVESLLSELIDSIDINMGNKLDILINSLSVQGMLVKKLDEIGDILVDGHRRIERATREG